MRLIPVLREVEAGGSQPHIGNLTKQCLKVKTIGDLAQQEGPGFNPQHHVYAHIHIHTSAYSHTLKTNNRSKM